MVGQEVIRIDHPKELRGKHMLKFILPIAVILFFVYFFIMFELFSVQERADIFPIANIIFQTLFLTLFFGPAYWYYDFNTFDYNSDEMILTSPARGPNKITREYHLPYSSIRKVSLSFFSTYLIRIRNDPFNPIESKWKRNIMLNIGILQRILRSKENERRIFESFDQLYHYYQRVPGAIITYHRPMVFYSRRWDVKKLRKEHGNIIFEVELPKGAQRPVVVSEKVAKNYQEVVGDRT